MIRNCAWSSAKKREQTPARLTHTSDLWTGRLITYKPPSWGQTDQHDSGLTRDDTVTLSLEAVC